MIYKSLFDDEGNEVISRQAIFIAATDDGKIESMTTGKPLAVNKTGYVYVVDEVVVKNIDKFKVINGKLQLRDGEQLDEPVRSEKEIQREELLRQLALLDADTEEDTDEARKWFNDDEESEEEEENEEEGE